jgi:multidrug resistance efflux pump
LNESATQHYAKLTSKKRRNEIMNHTSFPKKKIILLVVLILITSFIVFFYQISSRHFTGVVEATILSHTSEVNGKILEMPVDLGQHISKGEIIAVIDSTEQE